MKSLRKTKKKFEIQTAGLNLYLIVFELEEDLELIMEGRPWLFRKVGPCLPEFDKKDLLHAIGVTFGGVIRSEISGLSDYSSLNSTEKNKIREDPPYTLALKAESKLVGKESIKINDFSKKVRAQCSYTGDSENGMIEDKIIGQANNLMGVMHERPQVSDEEKMLKNQVDVATVMVDEQMTDNRSSPVINLNLANKASWKRIAPGQMVTQRTDESCNKKRKATEERLEIYNIEAVYGDGTKRLKKEKEKDQSVSLSEVMSNTMDQNDVQLVMGSAVAKRQANQTQ
ncbi:hypothetical protein Godav_023596 [Gossypium davidsonii]|uniref:DUF4283 domain-containing protein n=1 Tax=Gossypium davidsonii TaxID=34287 RepID=A0A7J8SS71_GOSDV|nr:hypothetical protein [Gossypium davidsonii]